METIGTQKLWSFLGRGPKAEKTTCTAVRQSNAQLVTSYIELARYVAELQFMNREFVLLFRGQSDDFRNTSGNTSLKPTIMRAGTSKKVPTENALNCRFEVLTAAEKSLVEGYRKSSTPGSERLRRQKILRWSLLQHYQVCKTPLLDVSHSLRIAASFATDAGGTTGYVFVVGVPNISGAITASAEAGIQVLRLASVCPPSAVRPHIQEGYLLGEYPEMTGVEQKQHYKHYEIDFGRRLIAKFRFEPSEFWAASSDFPQIPHDALYPTHDPILSLVENVKQSINGAPSQ